MLDERKAAILRAVVEEYIDTAQPVGSAHVVRSSSVQVSSATVRNDMAALEEDGCPRPIALRRMLDQYVAHMAENVPVHAWPVAERATAVTAVGA